MGILVLCVVLFVFCGSARDLRNLGIYFDSKVFLFLGTFSGQFFNFNLLTFENSSIVAQSEELVLSAEFFLCLAGKTSFAKIGVRFCSTLHSTVRKGSESHSEGFLFLLRKRP